MPHLFFIVHKQFLGVTFTYRDNLSGSSDNPVDLNTLAADGYYTIQGNISNGPSGIDARTWGACIVFRTNRYGSSILQVLIHDVGNTHSLYVRQVNSDGVNLIPWTKIAG